MPNARSPRAHRRALAAAATAALALTTTASLAHARQIPSEPPPANTPSLEHYLPADQAYDPDFPEPSSVLGWEVGKWHARHDQVVAWFETVAERSDRVQLIEYGRSHEQRPLLLAVVTSPENHARLEELRSAHVEAVRGGAESHDGPGIVWMGYGVHGSESSAMNASLLLAYHLAAATGDEIEGYLDRTVVLIDPCVNPDGSARFAQWANMHRGRNLTASRAHRDHDEGWPSGRTNHYWFDLNRDWLLLTHPESRGRIAEFQRWLPTVLTDYHEMGSGSTYFFQPGIPSRRNPLTPAENHELTRAIAGYHAETLDRMGRLYFTEERFDDFYYGKGSTYPDAQGSIGILFEQASSRGHLIETDNGDLSFPFTIQNQFATSLSTLKAADEMRDRLSDYQRRFYRDARRESAANEVQAWRFSCAEPARAREMAERLVRHGIEVRRDGAAYVVDARQPQFRMIRALFEQRTSWDDNTFYDVSAWTFPETFGVDCERLSARFGGGEAVTLQSIRAEIESNEGPAIDPDAAGWTAPWDSLTAPAAAAYLLEAGVRVQVSGAEYATLRSQDFDVEVRASAAIADPAVDVRRGSLVVSRGGQTLGRDRVVELLENTRSLGVTWSPITSGLVPNGPDLGSGSIPQLEAPKVLLAIGGSTSAYEAGEVWHDLDTRVGVAVTLVEVERIGRIDLDGFTHLVLVSGATSGIDEDAVRDFVRGGGVVIATKRSALWAAEHLMSKREEADGDDAEPDMTPRPYAEYDDARAVQRIAGTIFRAKVDTTHPLMYGLGDEIAVFRNFEAILPEGDDPFATPLRYTEEPLIAGYASEENVAKIAGSPAVRVERVGSGTVIAMIDDPVFRGVWYGTRPMLVNAIFFGTTVGRTGQVGPRSEEEAADYEHGHAHGK